MGNERRLAPGAALWVAAALVAPAAFASDVGQATKAEKAPDSHGPASLADAQRPGDPLKSPLWDIMHRMFFGGAEVVFDDRVQVSMPAAAEDAMALPVSVRVDGIENVEEVFVFSDLNPIPEVLRYFPVTARPYLSFRMKVQQATPVRAAVRTADGLWHVGGQWVDAVGGGCTAPSVGMASGDWESTLGDVSYKLWARGDTDRLRIRVMHPMDTGLAPGIPEFHIEELELRDAAGDVMARLETYEPVAENPVFSLDLPAASSGEGLVSVVGVDNNGNPVKARLAN